mgnify:CR=1 FL=1
MLPQPFRRACWRGAADKANPTKAGFKMMAEVWVTALKAFEYARAAPDDQTSRRGVVQLEQTKP